MQRLAFSGLFAVLACSGGMERERPAANDDDQTSDEVPPGESADAAAVAMTSPPDTRPSDIFVAAPVTADSGVVAEVAGAPPDTAGGEAVPPAAACPGNAQVCDDFEDGDLMGWVKQESGGKIEVEGTHAFGGARAVRITIPGGARGGFITRKGAPLFPLPKKTVYGRLMVFYEDMAGGHFDTIRGGTSGGGTPWLDIGGQGKAFFLNYFNGGSDCWSVPSGKPAIPRNKWMCWEFMFDVSANHTQFWVDGKMMRDVKGPGDGCVSGGNATWAAPNLGSVMLGEFNAQTAGGQTRMWLDDVALGTTARLGCPAAAPTVH